MTFRYFENLTDLSKFWSKCLEKDIFFAAAHSGDLARGSSYPEKKCLRSPCGRGHQVFYFPHTFFRIHEIMRSWEHSQVLIVLKVWASNQMIQVHEADIHLDCARRWWFGCRPHQEPDDQEQQLLILLLKTCSIKIRTLFMCLWLFGFLRYQLIAK